MNKVLNCKNAQTSLEFIVIFAVILILSFFISSSVYSSSEINKGIYSLKQNVLDVLTLNSSNSYINHVSYDGNSTDINFTVNIKDNDGFVFSDGDVNIFKINFRNTSKFDNVNVFFEYV